MLNTITVQGRLAQRPERRQTRSGVITSGFTVACQGDTLRDGERTVDFIPCTAFRQTAEFVTTYFDKGDPILVTGRLHSRHYQDRTNTPRVAWEILADRVYFAGPAAVRAEDTSPADPPLSPYIADDDPDLPF